jgi:hypothetical protein
MIRVQIHGSLPAGTEEHRVKGLDLSYRNCEAFAKSARSFSGLRAALHDWQADFAAALAAKSPDAGLCPAAGHSTDPALLPVALTARCRFGLVAAASE